MKEILCLVLICTALLAGCAAKSETYQYIGESENWQVVFQQKVDSLKNANDIFENELVITYLGDSEAIPDDSKIEYTFEIGGTKFSETIAFEEVKDSKIYKTGWGGSSPVTLQGHEVGTLIISWNGETEQVETKQAN